MKTNTKEHTQTLRDILVALVTLRAMPLWKLLVDYGVGFASEEFMNVCRASFSSMMIGFKMNVTPVALETIAMALEAAELRKGVEWYTARVKLLAGRYFAESEAPPWDSSITAGESVQRKALCVWAALALLTPGSPEHKEAKLEWDAVYRFNHTMSSTDPYKALCDHVRRTVPAADAFIEDYIKRKGFK